MLSLIRSVVLFEIDSHRIFAIPLERDAPWAIDVDCVAHGLALEAVAVETGHVHFFRDCRCIQRIWPGCPLNRTRKSPLIREASSRCSESLKSADSERIGSSVRCRSGFMECQAALGGGGRSA